METNSDVNLLINAFDTFKKASITLESYYRDLEKRVEELNLELAEKNNYLTRILEGLPVGIIVINNEGVIETINGMACRILEEPSETLKGKIFDLKVHLPGCGSKSLSKGIASCIEEEEIEIRLREDKKKTIIINTTLLKNLDGQMIGHLIVLKDVSEMKRLRESAQRNKRLAAMGEMAASLAHQIRNPLGSIELFASLLNEGSVEEAEKRRFIKEIIHGVRTLNATLSNMLLFANNSMPFKRVVLIKELIDESIGICKFLFYNKEIEVFSRNAIPDTTVLVDKELFKQALLNLIMNGVDAVRKKGSGYVSIMSRQDNGGVHIDVSDNGCGISEEEIDKVFDPFFTTKPKGTGLGLTVVNNIIRAHGGFIDVESIKGKGTTFHITLPEVKDYGT